MEHFIVGRKLDILALFAMLDVYTGLSQRSPAPYTWLQHAAAVVARNQGEEMAVRG